MPENHGDEVGVREEFGLRNDQAWIDWVAEHGTDGGTMMMLPIMLADVEIVELRERDERAMRTIGAFTDARLVSAAGAWLEHRAGGVVRLLLAHPDPAERAAAEAITDEHGGTVELVKHATRDLDQVCELILDEVQASTAFGQTATRWGIDVWANAVRLTLRGGLNPDIPEPLQAAVTASSLIIEHPTEPARWQPRLSGSLKVADPIDAPNEPGPPWPGDDPDDYWDHWHRCVRYVAERCVGGPAETARQFAEDIGALGPRDLSRRRSRPGHAHRTGHHVRQRPPHHPQHQRRMRPGPHQHRRLGRSARSETITGPYVRAGLSR